MLTLRTLGERRIEILRLAEPSRTGEVRVFGSVARGDSTDGSDVDLLVDAQLKTPAKLSPECPPAVTGTNSR
jgi:predicted nucleotidyltransferase